ncbi:MULTISPECIES: hypothetical protein [Vibrio]|uniref:Mobile element protein n=1 Tax=Vibrio tasmaniensis TaxID=212663 RepID=A0AB38NIW5_9VIBR|nr:hypothetical protein [Vibrio tasmaniensis]TKG27587.1 hypothetical protein FC057_22995 [Vibrio tasmaniensis]TKG34288.1 hypothetical protein FC063_25200 [Vibrio tasmaniensis]TKG39421.1 hypothetical protein FC060_24685 [Vibrio tasmaniensis]TKG44268.1 hypothetical protein FC061_21385 [Vibrio tasmaniensis]TKG51418.1 hypothetical protein FC070_11510 [Vibrio tasmaniensis]
MTKLQLTAIIAKTPLSDRRHLFPDASLLRTVRATFTAYGSSLHKGLVKHPVTKLPLRYTLKALKLPQWPFNE